MAYTPIDKSSDYINTVLYTGNGGTQSITGLDFAPNFVWLKSRTQGSSGYNGMHYLFDTIRGATKRVRSNDASAEATSSASLTAFNSDGFSVGSDDIVNYNNDSFVSWNWKAGTSFTNDASATGIGSIDSSGSVSTDAGFSIISYTGTGSAATVAHGLGVAPKMIINRTISAAKDWITYHASLGATKFVELNTTDAASTSSDKFNNTEPTSTVFSIESSSQNNTSGGTCLAYCFAEKQGYSKISSYTGNGSTDGTFVYTGFKPALFMIKRTDGSNNWMIWDNKRIGFNIDNNELYPNQSAAEGDDDRIDLLSNGIKWRNGGATCNGSGSTYVYMAFAENPFVTSTGIPTPGR